MLADRDGYGRTDPRALELLSALPRSEVRIPDAQFVVNSVGFRPRSVFHPKVWLFSSRPRSARCSIVVGSANLSLSALRTGTEAVWLEEFRPPREARDAGFLRQYQRATRWFQDMWVAGVPAERVLGRYAARWVAAPLPGIEVEPADGLPLSSTLESGTHLWVETGILYKNRGPGRAGNQIDLPRGFRVFFGFPATDVVRNTVLGELLERCEGFQEVTRTMRFGNNQMDKLNLPLPGNGGPATYDNSILMFEKQGARADGLRRFSVVVGDGRVLWRRGCQPLYEGAMHGGRRFGLLRRL